MIASQRQDWSRVLLRTSLEQLLRLWRSRAVRVSLGVFIALRVVTLLVAFVMVRDMNAARPDILHFNWLTFEGNPSGITYYASLPVESHLADLMSPWRRYDTAWYILIAMQGYYPDTRIVFPPLYPTLIRLVELFCGGNFVLASVIVSNGFCVVAFFLLYKLIQREWGDKIATRTLILLAAFPTGFYLIAGYTEPLFLTFTLGAFLAAFDRRWLLAGGLAFFASLTRLQGVALCLPLAWIAYVQYRESGKRALLSRIPVLIGAPLGTLTFVLYIAYNNLGSMENAYALGWKMASQMPWESVLSYIERLQLGIAAAHENNNAFVLGLMAILGVVVLLRFQRTYALYVWSTLAIILLRYHFGEGMEGAQFESAIRYVLLLFPCFAAAALILRRRWIFALCVVIMVAMQFYLLNDFVHWVWVA